MLRLTELWSTAADVPTVRFGGAVNDVPLLASDKVRYTGEPIALVAGTSAAVADEALTLIDVQLAELPLVDDPQQALEPGAPLVHEEWASYAALPTLERDGNVCAHSSIARGDVDAAFADAALVVDERSRRAYRRIRRLHQQGQHRLVPRAQVNFPLESHMDEIAERLGLDPLELRLRNLLEDGDRVANGQVVRRPCIRQVLERAAEAIDWLTPSRQPADSSLRRGKGLACCWWTTTQGSSAAYARANEDGSVVIVSGCAEIGTGAITAGVPKLVAARLGVTPQDVIMVTADTDTTPYDLGAQGSRSLYMAGSAALLAADDLGQKLLEIASDEMEVAEDDLVLRDGAARVRGLPDRATAIGDLVTAAMKRAAHPPAPARCQGS